MYSVSVVDKHRRRTALALDRRAYVGSGQALRAARLATSIKGRIFPCGNKQKCSPAPENRYLVEQEFCEHFFTRRPSQTLRSMAAW